LLSTIGTRRKVPGALVYLGKITYGLYVFHPWCLELGRYVIASFHSGVQVSDGAMVLLEKDGLGLAFTILAATLSYQLFEVPFLKLKDRFAFIHSRPV
jgi:peptidoglycan/LPS O-acetylase OafA/YrhL